MNTSEIKKLYAKIVSQEIRSDWRKKAPLVREAFALSAEYLKSAIPGGEAQIDELHSKISAYGDGWFCDNVQSLVILRYEKSELAKYIVSWKKAAAAR